MKERRLSGGEQSITNVEGLISYDDYERISDAINLNHYSKLASMLRLRRVGLPTLPGFVVQEFTPKVLDYVAGWDFTDEDGRVSLRFDSPNPEDNKRLMGSNPTVEDLEKMRDFTKPPVIGLVMGTNDRFRQGHSILTYFLNDRLRCEVVGPGFDAADLTRGNVTPHEVFEFLRKDGSTYDFDLGLSDIITHQKIDIESYKKSRQLRYGVIYTMLQKGLGRSVGVCELDDLQIKRVEEFLLSRGARVPLTYFGIDYFRLCKFYSIVSQLDRFRVYYKDSLGLELDNRVLSASYLEKYGLTFWDVYGADKYRKH